MENNQDTKNNTALPDFANRSDAAKREEKVLEFWKVNNIFSKSLAKKSPKGEFVFYEGPPTANGKPGIHHLEARSFKDAIPRYKTMQGFHVRRKGGWDTHGLAVEIQTEKELGLQSKIDIEKYGVAQFNQKCKESVWRYLDVWNKFTKRIGYWVDEENAYVTYHNEYIESVWNVVKKVEEQKLLYKDYKVVPWCPRCGTALSSHELAQGYEDVKDLSVYVKFHLKPNQEYGGGKYKTKETAYILAWTTTPWTLPGNVALAIGNNIKYTALRVAGISELNIVANDRVKDVFEGKEIEIVHNDIIGSDLVGLGYEPLFPYLKEQLEQKGEGTQSTEKMFKVYPANFVNTEDGTGIVHTAVMYGQDDFELGTKVGLPKHHLVNPEGNFIRGTGFLEGRFVRETNADGKPTLAVDIIENLKKRNLFFKQENYKHSYPHCWRCKTALIYYARDSWYIRMSDPKIKAQLISENQKINWEPKHIRDGRFGEWLREIKDWAISRERYWGTPLPVWQCTTCNKIDVIGSIADLKKKTKKSGNKYFVMRHGGTEANTQGIISFKKEKNDELTKEGREQVKKTAKKLINEKIDFIVSSPFTRTKETAEILKEQFGLKDEQIIFDDRLHELDPGTFDGGNWIDYHNYVLKAENKWFSHKIPEGESLKDVAERTGAILYELENKYKDKNILIVTHGGPAWLLYVNSGLHIPDSKPYQVQNAEVFVADFKSFQNAEVRHLPFIPTPHNEDYELDLHRPYIDEVALVCSCGGSMARTPEVMDVWLDSGAMPFAQDHYPFSAQGGPASGWDNQKLLYPADYISEGVDQTRGWFYTLHAVGTLMGRGRAYKNVICLGLLMDASGKKMSKSLGNIVEPFEMIDKYGVDTLRLWMYSVNQPGESKNFDEKTVALISNQVFGLLYNVLAFYELYPAPEQARDGAGRDIFKPKDALDQWILARLVELTDECTQRLDDYKLLEPVRSMRDFINDLSTWYLQCSRERIKGGDVEARQTLYFVLKNLAKLLAPFAPFTAEDIWLKLRKKNDIESIHLETWPRFKREFSHSEIRNSMRIVRNIVSHGLEERQKAGIKVRQPLNKLKITAGKLSSEYIEIIKDKLNVKEVDYIPKAETDTLKVEVFDAVVVFDTNITSELKQEGDYRELVRGLQDMRKKQGLTPSDLIVLTFETSDEGKKLVEKFENDIKKTVLVSKIEFKDNEGGTLEIDDLVFKVKIDKI